MTAAAQICNIQALFALTGRNRRLEQPQLVVQLKLWRPGPAGPDTSMAQKFFYRF